MWNTNVDSIVASLNKAVAKLEKLAAKKETTIDSHVAQIVSLQCACDDHAAERDRAYRVAEKLKGLLD